MNKERRENIAEAVGLMIQAGDILEQVLEEEQADYDNLPEEQQDAKEGEQMRENIEFLEEIIDYLEEAEDLEDM